MTKASVICNLIHDNPDTWRQIIKDKRIFIKEDGPLAIFNYAIKAKFNDPVVREARGIIIDIEKEEVVCWPFTKFTEYDDVYADEIDWSTAVVQEKIDGSIIKLWYNKLSKSWQFSTNSVIYAEDALCHQDNCYSFMDLIKCTDQYDILRNMMRPFSGIDLDKNNTYIFEITDPLHPVCIHYNERKLYHLGTRSNITGEEIKGYLTGMPRPKAFPINNLDSCIRVADALNSIVNEEEMVYNNCKHEGFVVVDANWNRIKVKSSLYLVLHDISSGSSKSKKLLIDMLYRGSINTPSICNKFPEIAHTIKYYDYKVSETMHEMEMFIDKARKLYHRCNCDKKEFAKRIPKCKYTSFAFVAVYNNYSIYETLETRHRGVIGSLEKMIPNYTPNKYKFDWEDI